MSWKIVLCLTLAGLLASLYTPSAQASPGVLYHVQVEPSTAFVMVGSTVQFTAQAFDDQNVPIAGLIFTWSVIAGGGTISATGLFTAGFSAGTFNGTVQATAVQGGITESGTAGVIVAPFPPYIYLAENPMKQIPEWQGIDNYVARSWFLGVPLLWWAHDSDIRSVVITAISVWQDYNAIPFLHFQEATDELATSFVF